MRVRLCCVRGADRGGRGICAGPYGTGRGVHHRYPAPEPGAVHRGEKHCLRPGPVAVLARFDTRERQQELQDFYEDPENNQEVPRKYGAGYIYLSSYERNSYEVDEEALDRLYLKVFENKEAKVYRIR